MSNNNTDVTWSQLTRWGPIIVGITAIILSYGALITQIEVINNKITNLTTLVENYQKHQENVVNSLNDLNKRIVIVETEHAMNRR